MRMHEHNLYDDDKGEEYQVERIIVHNRYNPPADYNDIALLKVRGRIGIKPGISPICLPIGDERTLDLNEMETAVIGWGLTSFGSLMTTFWVVKSMCAYCTVSLH